MNLVVFLALTTSLALGTFYSVHNTDFHHWGFIAGTALDYIKGLSFFTDIYIQYGVGQSMLFHLLSPFIPINYTSVGILTSIAYILNLLFIYLNLKALSTRKMATLIVFGLFLFNPYAHVPWPDYWAGLFLTFAGYFLFFKNSRSIMIGNILSGFFIFTSFLFRNTYALSFLTAAFAYSIICIFNKEIRSRKIFITICTSLGLIGLCLFCLHSAGTINLWYLQAFGSATSKYGIGLDSVFSLLKNILLPTKIYLLNNLIGTTISAFFYINLYVLYLLTFKTSYFKLNVKRSDPGTVAFCILLGMGGFIQALYEYDVFRIINGCSPLILVFGIFTQFQNLRFLETPKNRWATASLIAFFIVVLLRFPHASSKAPIYQDTLNSYSNSKIPFFKWHRFQKEDHDFYGQLSELICDHHSKILNVTMDSTIPYLCQSQERAPGLPFFNAGLPLLSSDEAYREDQVIVSEKILSSNMNFKFFELGRVKNSKASVIVYRVEKLN
jgi:hypothetical protein